MAVLPRRSVTCYSVGWTEKIKIASEKTNESMCGMIYNGWIAEKARVLSSPVKRDVHVFAGRPE